jgi:HTH-type transcriptional regulator/antitoxin HigA
MVTTALIATERQARETEAELAELDVALSSEQTLKAIVSGLPHEVVEGVRRSLATERRELGDALEAYERTKAGDVDSLKRRAGSDPGALLVAARIVRRLSQKDLARKLGMPEQQIQRYEAERYKSISLQRYQKVARALGARLSVDIEPRNEEWDVSYGAPSSAELSKVLRHARANGWLEGGEPDEKASSQLNRYVADHVLRHGTPSLLRTGLNVIDHAGDWVLLSWKAQVTRVAEQIIEERRPVYRPMNVSWLVDLVRLSRLDDGPVRARDLLLDHGIVVVVEPHIVGMKVDGAAFLVDGVPVIGMTLLRDAVDNFWFTLIHEIAHVVLHYRTGLAAGFFDDMTLPDHAISADVAEMEQEANDFASNLLIPKEVWTRSPARIARSSEPVEKLAQQLGIHPAIVFGKIRMERNDFSQFSNKIGRGVVRAQLMPRR